MRALAVLVAVAWPLAAFAGDEEEDTQAPAPSPTDRKSVV